MNNSNRRLSSISSSTSYRASQTLSERGKKTNCDICSEKFNLLHREHMCKRCSRSICSSCGKSKKIIAGYEKKPEKEHRICTICKKESDRLEEMRKEFGLQFGCDSKIVPTWLNTMGIQNWPDVEQNFKKMLILTKEQQNSTAYKLMSASMNMQSYNSNFQANYSFIEMIYFTQQEVQGKVHQTVKDTLTAFIGQYHDTIGFSEDLMSTATFLLCFSSPPKAFCLLEQIYSGNIIPKQLFPILDEEFIVNGNPLKKQCNEQILKLLKDKFKCDTNTLLKLQKFIEDAGQNCIESLMISKVNFETCYSLFDSLMTIQTSKYTHLIKFITTFLYVNRDIIIGKNSDNPFDLQKEILDKTQKDDLLVQMKWNISELPIPIYQDKVKDLQKANSLLIQEKGQSQATLQNLTSEIEQLKKLNTSLQQELEAMEKYIKTKEDQLQEDLESERKNLKDFNEKYKKEKEDSSKQNESKSSQMESTIVALQQKNKQLEQEKDELNTKSKGLDIDLQQTKIKNADEIANLKKQISEEQTISQQKRVNFEKIIDQLNIDISFLRDNSKQLENNLTTLQVDIENKDKDFAEATQKYQETLQNIEKELSEVQAKKDLEIKKFEVAKTDAEQKSHDFSEQVKVANQEIVELKEKLHSLETENNNLKRDNEDGQKKQSSLEILMQEQSQRQTQELRDKSEIFNQSIKEIARVKGDITNLQDENKKLKQQVLSLETTKQKLESESEQNSEQIKKLQESIQNLELSIQEKSECIFNLEIALKEKDDIIANLNSEIDALETDQMDIQDHIKEGHNTELKKKEESIHSLEISLTLLQNQIKVNSENADNNLKEEIHKKDKEIQQLRDEIKTVQAKLLSITDSSKLIHKQNEDNIATLKSQLEDSLNKLKVQEEDSTKELKESQTSFTKLREELQNLQISLEESESSHAHEKQLMEQREIDQSVLLAEYERKIKDQNQELTSTTALLKKQKDDNQRKEDQLQEKEKRIKQLSERINEAQGEVKKVVQQLEESKQEVERNEERLVKVEEELNAKQSDISTKEESIIQLRKTIEEQLNTIHKQIEDIQLLKQQVSDLNDTIESLESSKEEIHSQIRELNQEIKQKQSEMHTTIEKLQKQCDYKETKYNQLKEELNNLHDSKNQDTDSALHAKEESIQKLEKSTFELESSLSDKQVECERLTNQVNSLQLSQKKAKEDLTASINEAATLKKNLQAKEADILSKSTEITKLLRESQDSIENRNSMKDQLSKDIANLNTVINSKDKEIVSLKSQNKSVGQEVSEVKEQLFQLQTILEEVESAKNEANRTSLSKNAEMDQIEESNLAKQQMLEEQIKVLSDKLKQLELQHKEDLNTHIKESAEFKSKITTAEDNARQKENASQKQVQELKSQIATIQLAKEEEQNKLIQIKSECNKLQDQILQKESQLKEAEQIIETLERDIKFKDVTVQNLLNGEESSKKEEETTNQSREQKIQTISKELESKLVYITLLEEEKRQLHNQIKELDQKLNKISHKKEQLQKANEQFVSQLVDKENEYETMSLRIINLNKQIQVQEEVHKQLKEEHQQQGSKIKTLESKQLETQSSLKQSTGSNSAKEKDLLKKVDEQTALIKQYQHQLGKLSELEERIGLKNEENLILQQMIRSMTQNTPKQDSVSVIAFDKIKAENVELNKKMEILLLKYKRMILKYIAKFTQSNKFKIQLFESDQLKESLQSKVTSIGGELSTLKNKNSTLLSENTQKKKEVEEKDQMLQHLSERHQKQVIMLTEENSELLVQHKKLQNQLSATSNEVKVAYMKILLMSLEYERLVENHQSSKQLSKKKN